MTVQPMSVRSGIGIGIGVPIGIAVFTALASVAALALYRAGRTPPAPPVAAVGALAPSQAPTPEPAPPPAMPEHWARAATFDKRQRLVACSELMLSGPSLDAIVLASGVPPHEVVADDLRVYLLGGDSAWSRVSDQFLGPGISKSLRPIGAPEPVPASCSFPGRTLFGKCTVSFQTMKDGQVYSKLALIVHHYDPRLSDASMKACLAAKGEWWELPRDSLEYRSAQHRDMLRELN